MAVDVAKPAIVPRSDVRILPLISEASYKSPVDWPHPNKKGRLRLADTEHREIAAQIYWVQVVPKISKEQRSLSPLIIIPRDFVTHSQVHHDQTNVVLREQRLAGLQCETRKLGEVVRNAGEVWTCEPVAWINAPDAKISYAKWWRPTF